MTVLRMLAHRAGLIDQMVPQKVEQWVARQAGLPRPRAAALDRSLDQVLHVGYGAAWGALFGALTPVPSAGRAAAFGVGLWALGSCALFPLLGIGRAAWRSSASENALNITAHLAYAAVTAFLAEEFARQPRRDVQRRAPRRGRVA